MPRAANGSDQLREALSHLVLATLCKQCEQYEPKRLVRMAGATSMHVSSLGIHCCLQ